MLKCTTCGSGSLHKTDEGLYKCGYCVSLVTIQNNQYHDNNSSVKSMLDEGIMYLCDQKFDAANIMFDRVLEIDPKNVEAYIDKSMAKDNIRLKNDFFRSDYYNKNPDEKTYY